MERLCASCALRLARAGHRLARPLPHPSLALRPLSSQRSAHGRATAARADQVNHNQPHPPRIPQRHGLRTSSSSSSLQQQQPPSPAMEDNSTLDEFYADLLRQPLPGSAATQRPVVVAPAPSPSQASPTPTLPATASPADKARIVFGSRLAGPARRKVEVEAARAAGQGKYIAGTWIAPRPEEPDNCCMSGCVNCVWELYRDELEGWVHSRRAAKAREKANMADKARGSTRKTSVMHGTLGNRDGLGSGSIGDEDSEVEDIMSEVPVGIREFINTEQRLRRRRDAAAAAAAATAAAG